MFNNECVLEKKKDTYLKKNKPLKRLKPIKRKHKNNNIGDKTSKSESTIDAKDDLIKEPRQGIKLFVSYSVSSKTYNT